jgi:hypothetical protein
MLVPVPRWSWRFAVRKCGVLSTVRPFACGWLTGLVTVRLVLAVCRATRERRRARFADAYRAHHRCQRDSPARHRAHRNAHARCCASLASNAPGACSCCRQPGGRGSGSTQPICRHRAARSSRNPAEMHGRSGAARAPLSTRFPSALDQPSVDGIASSGKSAGSAVVCPSASAAKLLPT